ncbi:MAG TPA: hypothetical protein VFW27_03460 [Actinoplanes sp.]|nr:hypothetical protein [Actinoplanes sp.]
MSRRFWLAVARFAMRRAGVTLMSVGGGALVADPVMTASSGGGATITWRYVRRDQ